MTTQTMIIKRLREIHYMLLDTEHYPHQTWKRRKLLQEKNILNKMLLGNGVNK